MQNQLSNTSHSSTLAFSLRQSRIQESMKILFQKNILITLLLGFSSGLPLALSGAALSAWFATTNVSLMMVGSVTMLGLPYSFKFLWSPLFDRYALPFLGRRRGWILCFQILLILAISTMALFSPETSPKLLMLTALLVAFFSASQDIAINAYNIDLLKPNEKALGASMVITGYRVGMLVAGGLGLIIAGLYSFQFAYLCMAALMTIGVLTTFFASRPEIEVAPPKTLLESVVLPFVDFFKRLNSVWMSIGFLAFIIIYKLGDAFASSLISAFLIREIHMTPIEIGSLVKVMGFTGTILGAIWGALWLPRLGWFRALLFFGILQTISNLFPLSLLYTGPNYFIAGSAIFLDNLTGGMGSAAFLGLVMNLCNPRFTASQFALLSAVSSLGRNFIGPAAAWISMNFGWHTYFFTSVVVAIPGLILLVFLKPGIEKMNEVVSTERANLS